MAVDAVSGGRPELDELLEVLLRRVAGDELQGGVERDRPPAALGREVLLAGEGRLEKPLEAVDAVDVGAARDERLVPGRLLEAAGAIHRFRWGGWVRS